LIYIVGATYDELGGSQYLAGRGLVGNNVPRPRFKNAKRIMDSLSAAIEAGLVRACHDCSEGGMAVALAEMAFSGGMGMDIEAKKIPHKIKIKRDDYLLFSESNTRFVVEVEPKDQKRFEAVMRGRPIALIGKVANDSNFVVYGLAGKVVINVDINELKEAWQAPLRW
jgi:phosphoribosylformylglycinamidine synthase